MTDNSCDRVSEGRIRTRGAEQLDLCSGFATVKSSHLDLRVIKAGAVSLDGPAFDETIRVGRDWENHPSVKIRVMLNVAQQGIQTKRSILPALVAPRENDWIAEDPVNATGRPRFSPGRPKEFYVQFAESCCRIESAAAD